MTDNLNFVLQTNYKNNDTKTDSNEYRMKAVREVFDMGHDMQKFYQLSHQVT